MGRTRRTRPQETRGARTLARKEGFLVAYKKWGSQAKALEEAQVSYKTLQEWLREDAVFAEAFDTLTKELQLGMKEELETAAFRRAVVKSDRLAQFLLMRLDPAYGQRVKHEEGPIQVILKENLDLSGL